MSDCGDCNCQEECNCSVISFKTKTECLTPTCFEMTTTTTTIQTTTMEPSKDSPTTYAVILIVFVLTIGVLFLIYKKKICKRSQSEVNQELLMSNF